MLRPPHNNKAPFAAAISGMVHIRKNHGRRNRLANAVSFILTARGLSLSGLSSSWVNLDLKDLSVAAISQARSMRNAASVSRSSSPRQHITPFAPAKIAGTSRGWFDLSIVDNGSSEISSAQKRIGSLSSTFTPYWLLILCSEACSVDEIYKSWLPHLMIFVRLFAPHSDDMHSYLGALSIVVCTMNIAISFRFLPGLKPNRRISRSLPSAWCR